MTAGRSDRGTVALLGFAPAEEAFVSAALAGEVESVAGYADPAGLAWRRDHLGCVVVRADALDPALLPGLAGLTADQPDWSDLPVVLATEAGDGRNTARALPGSVLLLDWPPSPDAVRAVVNRALEARRRQFRVRDRLAALDATLVANDRNDERLRFAVESARLGFWRLTFPGRVLSASDLCKTNLGLPATAPLDYDGMLAIVDPRDREDLLERAQAAIDNHSDYAVECRVTTSTGQLRWAEIRARVTYDVDGHATGMVGLCLDITDRKAGEDRQQLLVRELHHRVKNTLSTVQAIVGATARNATGIDQFVRDITGRIISLANTHTLLTEELWQRASLHELLAKELDLYDSGNTRVRVNGPPVELPSNYAVPLGMAFHELTTNAAKYGALANGHGYVAVDWTLEPAHPTPTVRIAWAEHDGPAVAKPTRQGFGTRLLQRVLTAQMSADVAIDYAADGLRVAVSFPLPDPASSQGPVGWRTR